MSTVFLHIGTAKTGTTAIQRFFPENRGLLREKGFAYPDMPFHFPRIGEGRNAHFLTLFNDEDPESKRRWEEGFKTVATAASLNDYVILSDENLWRIHAEKGFLEKVKAGFDEIGVSVKIVVYFRRQDEMAESHWNQMVKGKPKLSETFEDFVTKGEYADFPLEYDKGLERMAKVFGKENLIVRVYEKQQFLGGDLFSDFMNAVGLDPKLPWKYPEHVANTRLPENVVEIKRLINTVETYRDDATPNFFRDVIRQAYGLEMMKEIPEHKTGRFSDETRQRYMRRFEDGNAWVAKEYLRRATGALFLEGEKGLPQWEPNGWEMIKDVVRVLSGADVLQYKKIRELEKENKALKKQVEELRGKLGDQAKRMEDMNLRLEEMYNSWPFRTYQAIRGRKRKDTRS